MEKKGVKLFNSAAQPLDNQINQWMKDNAEAEVVDIKMTSNENAVYALVLYTFEGAE